MNIDSELIKTLRLKRGWSQEKLSEASGLSLRTIQRLESSGRTSIESVRILADLFAVDPDSLSQPAKAAPLTPYQVILDSFRQFADFSGTMTRYEYGWFFLFTLLVLAVATLIHNTIAEIAAVLLLLPFLAAGSRRLNDSGQSPWWQLLFLVPFGFVAVLFLLARESRPVSLAGGQATAKL